MNQKPSPSAMKVIYIAGPFRASDAWEIECNIRRAETAALSVWRLGAAVLCPHTNTRFFSGAAPDDVWLRGGLELLRRCDAVYVIGDSSGTWAEIEEARRRHMPVFRILDDVRLWINEVD